MLRPTDRVSDANAPVMTAQEREGVKKYFIAERGYWRPWVQTMLEHSPGFVQQYASYAGYPARTGPLSERMVELIYVALDSSSSHLFVSGLQTHLKRALEVGASQADVFDVLHLVAIQGLASVCQAADILAECDELDECEVADATQGEVDSALKDRLQKAANDHGLDLQALARMDPGYAAAVLDFMEGGRPAGPGLADSERSLIQLALHACFTAFNPEATRRMVLAARSQGVSRPEMLQAIQLGAHLAVHGTALGTTTFQELTQAAST